MSEWKPLSKQEIIGIAEAHDKLTDRALEIVDNAPFHEYVCAEFAQLLYDPDKPEMIAISWGDDDYDRARLPSCEFPIKLLSMTDAELSEWRKEQERDRAERDAKARAEEARQTKARERALYLALKAKYENAL